MTTINPGSTATLRLWQLISPALPVGAYAYSQGLEYAVQAQWVKDEDTTHEWISGQINHSLCHLDVPVLVRLHKAWCNDNLTDILYWNRYLQASRETSELLKEDQQLGESLMRLLRDLNIEKTKLWPSNAQPSFVTLFALASSNWMVTPGEAAQGYLWSWCENQIAAAIKLVPIGQTAGQRILSRLIDDIPGAVDRAMKVNDDDIGMLSPAVGLASALHETQYTRLFRS